VLPLQANCNIITIYPSVFASRIQGKKGCHWRINRRKYADDDFWMINHARGVKNRAGMITLL